MPCKKLTSIVGMVRRLKKSFDDLIASDDTSSEPEAISADIDATELESDDNNIHEPARLLISKTNYNKLQKKLKKGIHNIMVCSSAHFVVCISMSLILIFFLFYPIKHKLFIP